MPRARSAIEVQADIKDLIVVINNRSRTALTNFSDGPTVGSCLAEIKQAVDDALKLVDIYGKPPRCFY